MVKKIDALESFNAFKWLATTVTPEQLSDADYDPLVRAVEHRLGFETWAEENIPKAKFKYKGWDLVYEAPYGEIKLEPNTWIVLIPDEDNKNQINFMTEEQIETYFNIVKDED